MSIRTNLATLGLVLAAAVAMPTVVAASATAAPAAQAMPAASVSITEPVEGGSRGFPYSSSIVDLKPYGYNESEYFVSGTAQAFKPISSTLGEDGRWQVARGAASPFKTRILVRRPPAAKFNGTVIVEYMQEYYGSERDTNYRWNAETILRNGFGWVGISMHHEGIDDSTPAKTITYNGQTVVMGQTLARWDPQRYGTLSVPSTDLSYDILTQVGRALKSGSFGGGKSPFDGLRVRHLIGAGNTIAAERLAIYVNAVQNDAKVFDAFYLQDLHTGANLKLSGVAVALPVVRTDVNVPVIVLNTTTASAERGARPEGPLLRYWSPAGSSHTTGAYMERVGLANSRDFGMTLSSCRTEIANSFPVQYVSGAALMRLDRWIKVGKAPPTYPQLAKFSGPAQPVLEPRDYFDANGNPKGGLRLPWVEVPIARYDWRGECVGGAGRTFPFTAEQLKAIYGTPKNYHRKFQQAVRKAEKQGLLLAPDAQSAIAAAKKVQW